MNTTLATFIQAAITVLIMGGLVVGIAYAALNHTNTKQQQNLESTYQIQQK